MYTEEEEFNYDDYLDENNESNNKKSFIDWHFILKVILIIILIVLVIFLVFKIKNKNASKPVKNNNNTNNIQEVSMVFDNNMDAVLDASKEYFFTKGNLPEKIGETKSITVKKLIDGKYLTELVDYKGNVCGYNTSGASITKYQNDYKLEVTVKCSDKQDTKTYYFDLKGNCLTCNGENYNHDDNIISDNVEPEVDIVEDNTDKIPDNNNDKIPTEEKVCKDFSDWSTVYVAGNNYEVQTRTLVKGYKDEVIYGEWSEPTTEEIVANDKLEVKTYTEDETVSSKTSWSRESTIKPSNKSGREISSRTETIKTTKKVCTNDRTYTRTLTKWDNSAYKCKTISLGKVECTYKVKGSCYNVPSTKTVTYYKYRDKTTKTVTKTYYQSRTITNNVTYTDYMLESELPEGYAKVVGSERVEYRYREKCSK